MEGDAGIYMFWGIWLGIAAFVTFVGGLILFGIWLAFGKPRPKILAWLGTGMWLVTIALVITFAFLGEIVHLVKQSMR